ncbi:unnamed protein product [Oncorhynchus mykiss]|uniref:Vacuole membrane protein 1 n=1 Tax=Oncorhynchus mykiss TaxID=8022 RepID=A0A060Y4D3_ONCMY|nr:unnamed protein product [Oncorhynchus mykiss]
MVQRVGFFGILACASIPNPLFDLAGITCGHFLVPFWTFFGATLIGKAIIKMHIQKLFVIITFSSHIVEQMVSLIGAVPVLGSSLQKPFREYLQAQRAKMHLHAGEGTSADENWLSWVFEKVIVVMVCFFVCSIVNSMAQSYAKRQQQQMYSEGKTNSSETLTYQPWGGTGSILTSLSHFIYLCFTFNGYHVTERLFSLNIYIISLSDCKSCQRCEVTVTNLIDYG